MHRRLNILVILAALTGCQPAVAPVPGAAAPPVGAAGAGSPVVSAAAIVEMPIAASLMGRPLAGYRVEVYHAITGGQIHVLASPPAHGAAVIASSPPVTDEAGRAILKLVGVEDTMVRVVVVNGSQSLDATVRVQRSGYGLLQDSTLLLTAMTTMKTRFLQPLLTLLNTLTPAARAALIESATRRFEALKPKLEAAIANHPVVAESLASERNRDGAIATLMRRSGMETEVVSFVASTIKGFMETAQQPENRAELTQAVYVSFAGTNLSLTVGPNASGSKVTINNAKTGQALDLTAATQITTLEQWVRETITSSPSEDAATTPDEAVVLIRVN